MPVNVPSVAVAATGGRQYVDSFVFYFQVQRHDAVEKVVSEVVAGVSAVGGITDKTEVVHIGVFVAHGVVHGCIPRLSGWIPMVV